MEANRSKVQSKAGSEEELKERKVYIDSWKMLSTVF
jgi:hypothetical protein